jgi:16S rRNA (guanine966-N2)-methyltransferase
VRPTASKVRGAIFDILAARGGIAEKRWLDLFAGSGALGLEALSRGASFVLFVDEGDAACRSIRANLEASGLRDRAAVRRARLPRGLERLGDLDSAFDGALVDPPYRRGLAAEVLASLGARRLLAPGAWVVVEHSRDDPLADVYGCLARVDTRRYGTTALSLYARPREREGE